MMKTKEWAAAHGVCTDDTVPPVDDYFKPFKRTSDEVALRTIILHSIAAVGYEVDPHPIIGWLKAENVWEHVSPNERTFFLTEAPSDTERSDARWRQEALWALLWTINMIDMLGLPTQTCDTARLVDEIMPALGDPIDSFLFKAQLRPPSELLAEVDRIYNLHCYARQAYHQNSMPADLVYDVLFQRHYAFEWLNGEDEWDNIQTDT